MAKHSLEVKIKAVNDVLELGMSACAVAKGLNTVHSVVQRWVALYEKFGVEGLHMKSKTYTGDFKVHVVEYIHENGLSLFQGAVHFGIPSDSTVGKWDHIYFEDLNLRQEHGIFLLTNGIIYILRMVQKLCIEITEGGRQK
ncbi:transposase [Clostridium paridis]|uniref:Transposase n=1 Tax=Clostridium paridis TaxID=2803863 RepID=A0A937K3H5_9CLOT|nr:transposase [Clostridium paridis]MBL4931647.1 transposase [Clostridium paridis]